MHMKDKNCRRRDMLLVVIILWYYRHTYTYLMWQKKIILYNVAREHVTAVPYGVWNILIKYLFPFPSPYRTDARAISIENDRPLADLSIQQCTSFSAQLIVLGACGPLKCRRWRPKKRPGIVHCRGCIPPSRDLEYWWVIFFFFFFLFNVGPSERQISNEITNSQRV